MAKRFKKSAHSDAPRSQRQLRVGELLRQKLSEVFSSEGMLAAQILIPDL